MFQIQFTVKADLNAEEVGFFAEFLQNICLSVSSKLDGESWCFLCVAEQDYSEKNWIALIEDEFPERTLEEFSISEIDQNTDWLTQNYEALPAFEVDEFYIYGAHISDRVDQDKIGLQIEAATAFGSGSHGTTAGCLKALSYLKKNHFTYDKILDLGTGSGILSIAAEKLWPQAKIVATDIDPRSIDLTERHVELNHSKNISTYLSEGFHNNSFLDQAPYDLIIANILAEPLRELSNDIIKNLKENGKIILSGMLIEQEKDILFYYPKQKIDFYHIDEWSTVILG